MVPKISPARPTPLPKRANKDLAANRQFGMIALDELLSDLCKQI
jgi:hypothetical protein